MKHLPEWFVELQEKILEEKREKYGPLEDTAQRPIALFAGMKHQMGNLLAVLRDVVDETDLTRIHRSAAHIANYAALIADGFTIVDDDGDDGDPVAVPMSETDESKLDLSSPPSEEEDTARDDAESGETKAETGPIKLAPEPKEEENTQGGEGAQEQPPDPSEDDSYNYNSQR